MANEKLTALTQLTVTATGDWVYIVDVSDTTDDPAGTSKKITRSDFLSGYATESWVNSQNFVDVSGSGVANYLAGWVDANTIAQFNVQVSGGELLVGADTLAKQNWVTAQGYGTGTVTSVAVSGSDGIEVDSGSPVVNSGTIALGIDAVALLSHINVENGADVTDETNVTSALDGATLTDIGAPAASDRVLIQDNSDSNNLKYAAFNQFGGGGSLTATDIIVGTASATGNNFHGVGGTITAISWDATTNDTGEVTSFTNGDTDIQITNAGHLLLTASVAAIDNGVNNRSTYFLQVRILNSSDVEQYLYWCDDTYIRDDANDYDSGLMSTQMTLFVNAGDKIQVRVLVKDEQTNTGTVNASTTYSKIRLQKVS